MDKRFSKASGPSHARQGTKLQDMLMSEKHTLSYDDFHHQITGNDEKTFSKSVRKQQRGQGIGRKSTTEDEPVRYISNLPSQLANGGARNVREKTSSASILDWGRLEKWRHNNHKQVANKDNGYSPSSSSTSHFSTEGSTTRSTRGQSCSLAHPRMPHSSLESHPEASPHKNYNQDVKLYCSRDQSCSPAHQRHQHHRMVSESHYPKVHRRERNPLHVNLFGRSTGKSQEPCAAPSGRQRKPLGTDQCLRITEADIRLDRCQRKESLSSSSSEMGMHKTSAEHDVSSQEGFMKVQDGLTTKDLVSQQGPNCRESTQRKMAVTVLLPKVSSPPKRSKVKNDGRQAESILQGLSDNSDGVLGLGCSSDIPYSCPLPSTDECVKEPGYTSATERIDVPSQLSGPLTHSACMSSSPLRSKIKEEKNSVMLLNSISTSKTSADLSMRRGSESTPRRSASPIKKFSHGVGKIIRNVGSRDNTPLRRSCSNNPPAKSESAAADSGSDSTCSDRSVADYRSRSSPLRRLLDPLFKPKSNSQVAADGFRRDSTSTAERCSASSERQSAKVKARATIGRTTSCTHSHPKNKSSSFQALLQVAVKNGLPLYTFAVDNNSEILAATLRKSSAPEKSHNSWTYTFFTVHEMKKKNGLWIHQGGKVAAPGYVPNVVAQMKVSDPPQYPNVTGKHRSKNHECTARVFTLFAVDVGQQLVDQHAAAEFYPTNELAAIIVRKPEVNPHDDGRQPGNINNVSGVNSTRGSTILPAEWTNQPSVSSSSDCSLNTTVILPGGVHTVPSKGAVSTLTQRWESGGSCDCGGWDLGCQLRVYTSRIESNNRSGVSEIPTYPAGAAEFKLFCQAADDKNQAILSLRPFKERIHSVEFGSSLSLLQAFAICVAALDCKRPSSGLSEPPLDNVISPSGASIPEDDVNSSKVLNQNQVDAGPARYVSYPPPHSPVGRV